MVDAISAIKARISTMSEQEIREFERETGISIDAINIMNPEVAEEYCETHGINLSDVSLWNAAKISWQKAHENYMTANADYHDLKDIENSAKNKYDTAYTSAVEKNNGAELTRSEDNKIRRQTNYTEDTMANTKNAENTADYWLAQCQEDVGTMQRTLAFG